MITKFLTSIVVFLILVFVAIAGLSLSSVPFGDYFPILATPTVDCAPIVVSYKHDVLRPRLIEVIDAIELMNNTPRMSLPTQIANFQEIRRNVADNVPDGCVMDLHNRLMKALNNANAGFMAFLANDDDVDVSIPIALATSELLALADEVK